MKLDKYALKAASDQTVFEFISEGERGAIRKIILFQETTEPNLYNLAFGDRDPLTGGLNDISVSNNGDPDKILATVVAALYSFCERYPDAFVYATGSTRARTRLYRMGITRFTTRCGLTFSSTDRLATSSRNLSCAKSMMDF